VRIATIDSEQEFALLAPEWDALLRRSLHNGPFLRHHWLQAWWETYGVGRLNVVTLRRGGDLIGVLPTFTATAGRLPPARVTRFLGDEGVGSTGLSPFALPEVEHDAFERFSQHLLARHSDVVDLRFMDEHSAFFGMLEHGGTARVYDDCGSCPRIELPGDWDTYLGSLSKHMRHEVRRSQRRVTERGLELEVISDAGALPDAVDDFLRLHEGRMRSKEGAAFVVPEAYAAFTRRVMSTLLDEGSLRLMFLRLGDRRLAAIYLLRDGDTMFAEQSGFDETEARSDALRTLWAYAIRGAIEEGCSMLDMLIGEQRYKSEFGADNIRRLSHVRAYNPTLRGLARRARDAAVEARRDSSAASEPSAEDASAG